MNLELMADDTPQRESSLHSLKIKDYGVHWVYTGLSLTICKILGKLLYHLCLSFLIYINTVICYLVIMRIK